MFRLHLLIFTLFISGTLCRPQSSSREPYAWDQKSLQKSLEIFTAEPHTVGSDRQAVLTNWLQSETEQMGLQVTVDSFAIQVPDPSLLGGTSSLMQSLTIERSARNVYAKLKVAGSDCVILIGSHYDSKRIEGISYVGANDSGSSSAALLEIMRQLKAVSSLSCSVMAVWFDGEEAWLPEWRDGQDRHPARQQDNLYGSRHLAAQLQNCKAGLCLPENLGGESVKALVLMDMIGMPKVQLTLDASSDPRLMQMARDLDQSMNKDLLYSRPYPKPIEDDHRPFMDRGVPSVNLIGFENLQTWHQASDVLSTLDLGSIEKVSQLAIALVTKLGETP